MANIFISYRRADTAAICGRIYDRLEAAFGDKQEVFLDIADIPTGADFPVYIQQNIEQSDVVLVLMGEQWLNTVRPDGTRRLDDPGDFVRREVEMALSQPDCLVIPVLINAARMPTAAELPPSLQPLIH